MVFNSTPLSLFNRQVVFRDRAYFSLRPSFRNFLLAAFVSVQRDGRILRSLSLELARLGHVTFVED